MAKKKETTVMRERILSGRGIAKARPTTTRHRKFTSLPPTPNDHNKTHAMKLQELKFGVPIEELLLDGSESQIAAKLGVDKSTISKWIKRLDLVGIRNFIG